MKRIAILLGSALSLGGGVMLLSTGPVQAQASACSAEIMYVQQELRSTPITANRSYIKPSATPRTNSADRGATALATTSPTRLGTRLGESLGQGPSAGPGGYRETAHAVPSGSGEARGPGALPDAPGLRSVPTPAQTEPMDADRIQSGGALRRGTNPDEAAEALARARAFDQAGDDRACMNAVKEAKRYLR